MAQPAQVFTPLIGSGYEYVVIDNSGPPSATVSNAGSLVGYDTTSPGAISQSVNKFANGNIPDFISSGKTFTTTAAVVVTPMIISYKLPS